MIKRSDGGMAGGVLELTDEMQRARRPAVLARLHRRRRRRCQGRRRSKPTGGKALMPAVGHPGVGRLAMVTDPQGAPFYLMNPIPPEGEPDATATSSRSTSRSTSAGTSCGRADPAGGARLLQRAVRLGAGRRHGYGRNGQLPVRRSMTASAIGAIMRPCPSMPPARLELLHRRRRHRSRDGRGRSRRRHDHRWARWKSRAANCVINGDRPAGRVVRRSSAAQEIRRETMTDKLDRPACGSTMARRARRRNSTPRPSPTAMSARR